MTYIMAIGIDNLLEAIKRVGLKGMTLSLVEEALLGPVLLLILFSIISSITSFIQERAMASLSERVTLRIRKEVTKSLKLYQWPSLTITKWAISLVVQQLA